jgi:hypothetical protein
VLKKPERKVVDDYDDDFHNLNIYQLPQEWRRQPQLMRKYGDRVAAAKKAVGLAEANLVVVQAEVDRAIRQEANEKPTEPAIKNAVILDPRCKAAKLKVLDAQEELDYLVGTLRVLEHRKAALEDLVKLRLRDLFAEPTVPEEDEHSREAWDREQKKAIRKGVKL